MTEEILPLNGKLESVQPDKRQFVLKDVDGVLHPLSWVSGPLDDIMRKWKPGYYLTVTFNPDKAVKNTAYWQEGKEKFPKPTGGGGRSFVPRNEKAMMFNNALQVFGALYVGRLGNNSSGQNWETSVESVIKAAEDAVKRGSIAAGVQ